MKHDATIELFSYWNRLRGTRVAPERTEIEPGDIRQRLGDTFILENSGAVDATFRLAGTRLCAIHGRELKGQSFVSLWTPSDRGMIARLLRSVFKDKAVVVAGFEGQNDRNRRVLFELLLLPLADRDDERRMLGLAVPMHKPYWLGAHPIVENHIQSIRVLDPMREPVLLKNRPPLDLPARPAVSGADQVPDHASPIAPGGYRRVGHLAVFEGGKPAE